MKGLKILVVRKMSSLEFYYSGNHKSAELSESKNEQDGNIELVLRALADNGYKHKVVTRNDLTEALKRNCNLIDEYDFVFSLGGDGTVIATAAFNKDKPQLNLKNDTKSSGNLCQQSTEQSLRNFLNRNYSIEEWTRQDVYLDGKFIGRALNETAVGEGLKITKMARYNLKIDRHCEYHRNSAIIIATGTGSTGWPAAFDKYSKESKIFRYLTILPCEGSEKGEGSHFEIEYKGHEGKFALDTVEYDLPRDSLLEIRLSEYPLKIIQTGSK